MPGHYKKSKNGSNDEKIERWHDDEKIQRRLTHEKV